MKELSIEEKAKAYDEAIEKARKLATDLPNGRNDRIYHIWDLESIFPELRESEDEKIRKELIEHVKDQQSSFISAPDCRDKYEEEENNKYNSWLVWLEKQGEQKPQRMVSAEAKEALYDKPACAWSEEDEEMCQETIDWFEKKCFPYALENDNPARESIKWLKSLKNRVISQPKSTWSEEDQNALEDVREAVVHYWGGDSQDILLYWLKSLKQRIKGE